MHSGSVKPYCSTLTTIKVIMIVSQFLEFLRYFKSDDYTFKGDHSDIEISALVFSLGRVGWGCVEVLLKESREQMLPFKSISY